jgi:hypothetical protein
VRVVGAAAAELVVEDHVTAARQLSKGFEVVVRRPGATVDDHEGKPVGLLAPAEDAVPGAVPPERHEALDEGRCRPHGHPRSNSAASSSMSSASRQAPSATRS